MRFEVDKTYKRDTGWMYRCLAMFVDKIYGPYFVLQSMHTGELLPGYEQDFDRGDHGRFNPATLHEATVQWIRHGVTGAVMCVTLDSEYDELSTDYAAYTVLKREKVKYLEEAP